MKRLLLWLIGVALGVVVLLAAVLGVSYSFTSEGAKPVSEVQFAGQERRFRLRLFSSRALHPNFRRRVHI